MCEAGYVMDMIGVNSLEQEWVLNNEYGFVDRLHSRLAQEETSRKGSYQNKW